MMNEMNIVVLEATCKVSFFVVTFVFNVCLFDLKTMPVRIKGESF